MAVAQTSLFSNVLLPKAFLSSTERTSAALSVQQLRYGVITGWGDLPSLVRSAESSPSTKSHQDETTVSGPLALQHLFHKGSCAVVYMDLSGGGIKMMMHSF